MSPQPPGSGGATLLEACLAVAIVSTLTLIALPALRDVQHDYSLRAAAHAVRAELHRARILAIVRNQDCRLRVTSGTSYLVECQTPDWVPIQVHTVRSGHTVHANNRPEFHPRGNVAPMATVTLRNSVGQERRLIVNRSGRVRME